MLRRTTLCPVLALCMGAGTAGPLAGAARRCWRRLPWPAPVVASGSGHTMPQAHAMLCLKSSAPAPATPPLPPTTAFCPSLTAPHLSPLLPLISCPSPLFFPFSSPLLPLLPVLSHSPPIPPLLPLSWVFFPPLALLTPNQGEG